MPVPGSVGERQKDGTLLHYGAPSDNKWWWNHLSTSRTRSGRHREPGLDDGHYR